MAITDWPRDERPREKLLLKGAEALTDAELLAIFLRTGTPGKSAVDLARNLIAQHQGLAPLLSADRNSFCRNPGLGDAKFCQLQAVLEMGRRYLKERVSNRDLFQSADDTRAYIQSHLAGKPNEIFACLFLDTQHRLIEYRELFQGTIDSAQVHPREVVRTALMLNAGAVILAHNHPSGVAEPSRSDELITEKLKQALGLIEVRVLDHVIVGAGEITSLAERGMI